MISPPRAFGPFRIAHEVEPALEGRWPAHHSHSGLPVWLRAARMQPGQTLERVRRTLHELGRLEHPGIAAVLAHGYEQGWLWYALMRVEGVSWRADVGGALRPLAPEAIARALTVARRIAATLAFLHGEGIVHGSLHPDDILLAHGDVPVIADVSPMGPGPRCDAYLAPEQVLEEPLDGRADLYALGAILYELLTGHPPIEGDAAIPLPRAHLFRSPVPPSIHVPRLPVKLVALVLRLLQKRPQDRVGLADDVAIALADLGALPSPSAWPAPRPHVLTPPFVGNAHTLRDIKTSLDLLDYGVGQVLLLGGEPGSGKTRLLVEAMRLGRARGLRVLSGAGATLDAAATEATSHAGPLQPLRPILRAAVALRADGSEAAALRSRLAILAPYEESLSAGEAGTSAPDPLPAAAARLRVVVALEETFRDLASDRPVLVLLDDFQWADELSVGFLVHLCRSGALESLPVMFLLAHRTGEAVPLLDDLGRQPQVRRLATEPLDAEGVASMMSGMLGSASLPVDAARSVALHTSGNPLFVSQLVQAAVAEGALHRGREGWETTGALTSGTVLPAELAGLLARRLAGLPPAARSLMEAASVLGPDAHTDVVARVGALGSADLRGALSELCRRGLVREGADGAILPSHDLIRAAASATLTEARARSLHGEAASALEERARRGVAPRALSIAHHRDRAGEVERALPWLREAAWRALKLHAHAQAEDLCRAYLAGAAPSAATAAVRRALATEVLAAGNRHAEAIRELELATAEAADDPGEQASCLLAHAQVLCGLGRTIQALALCDRAAEVNLSERDPLVHAEARFLQGEIYEELGQLDAAADRLGRAREIFRAAGDRRRDADARQHLAIIEERHGRSAVAGLEEVAALRREIGDRTGLARTLTELASRRTDPGSSRVLLLEALALHRGTGDIRATGRIEAALAELDRAAGDTTEAEARLHRAMAAHRAASDRPAEGMTLASLADLLWQAGRVEEARPLFRQSLQMLREVGALQEEARTLLAMADLERLAAGRWDAAHRLLREADALVTDRRDPASILGLCKRGHLALARSLSARSHLARAEERARELPPGVAAQVSPALDALRRAVDAAEAGLPLWRGQAPADVAAGLRSWLTAQGIAPAAPVRRARPASR